MLNENISIFYILTFLNYKKLSLKVEKCSITGYLYKKKRRNYIYERVKK